MNESERAELETALHLVDEAGEPPIVEVQSAWTVSHRAVWVLAKRVRELEAETTKLVRIREALAAYDEFPHRSAYALHALDTVGRMALQSMGFILDETHRQEAKP